MKNILVSIFVIMGMVFNSVVVFAADEVKTPDCNLAQDRLKCLTEQGNNSSSTETTIPEGTMSNLPMSGNTQTTQTFGALGDAAKSGAYSQAAAAKDQANTTMMMALAMAAMMAMQCGPKNPTACMLAAAAAAAAAMAASKKSQAQALMNTLGNSGTSTTTTTDTTQDAANAAELQRIRDQMAAQGYKLNADGSFTAPNGALVDSGLSESSLAGAGMDGTGIASVKSGVDKFKKDLQDKLGSGGLDGSGSGGGKGDGSAMSGAYGSKGGNSTSETGKGNPNANGENTRDPASWDGFYKQYGDSLIGVEQGDIFLMVQKRVERERISMGH